MKEAFTWTFTDRTDPSQGGYWEAKPNMLAMAQSLADRIFKKDNA